MQISFHTSLEPYKSLIERALEGYGVEGAVCFLDAQDDVNVWRAPVRLGQVLDNIAQTTMREENGRASLLVFERARLDLSMGLFWASEDSKPVRLTDKECAVLRLLYEAGGQVVSKEQLLRDVWDYAQGVETHTVETHIYRLRQKIEDNSAEPKIVVTKGQGYILAPMLK